MILYFSGTGNSAHAAKVIASQIGDQCLDLFDRIKTHNHEAITSDKPWIIVVPTYAWQIPRIVRDWLLAADLQGSNKVYFVMTCGDEAGNAEKYNQALCVQKEWTYMGTAGIVMPENYIAMFDVPDEDTAKRIVNAADRRLCRLSEYILQESRLPKEKVSLIDKLKSGIVNTLFYPLFVKAKKFYVKEHCTSCGLCAKVCPMNNIKVKNVKPVWGKNCTHCMACICKCPVEAIEYGKISEGKPRYLCPKE